MATQHGFAQHEGESGRTVRLFAMIQESTEYLDGRIVAWGTAFFDYAEVVSADKGHQ